MNRSVALRALALLIAIMGVADPSFTREERVRPEIALVASDGAVSPALLARVRSELAEEFSIIDGPFGGAAATVVVGASLPAGASALASPLFAVMPARRAPDVRIVALRAPGSVSIDAVAGIDVEVEASGRSGDSVVVTLRDGATLMDRVARAVSGEGRVTVPVAFVPTTPGLAVLQAGAEIVRDGSRVAPVGSASASATGARADFSIDVRGRRLRVLFHDARPSWMSTFVRRTLERDARVTVTSRVVTSRGITTDAGRPPALAALGTESPFDVIVLGAPESLTSRDVDGLETFLRRRGGSVVLLLDGRTPGPYDRLLRVGGWTSGAERDAVALAPVDSQAARSLSMAPGVAALRVTGWVAPRLLPAGATGVLRLARPPAGPRGAASANPNETAPAVVWRTSVGAGTLLVSGALDSWRYRDSTRSAFGGFWRTTVASLGEAAIPPIALALSPAVVRPGADVAVHASLRDRWDPRTGAEPVTVSARVAPDSGGDSSAGSSAGLTGAGRSIRLWPAGAAGTVEGSTRAPAAPGRYRVTVTAQGPGLDSLRADAVLVVADSAEVPGAISPVMVSLRARGHGGRAVPDDSLPALRRDVSEALSETRRTVPWYPMRSGWWIVPFAVLLSAEWWIRRRRGLL